MVRKKCAIIVWNKRIKQQVYAIYPAISGGGALPLQRVHHARKKGSFFTAARFTRVHWKGYQNRQKSGERVYF